MLLEKRKLFIERKEWRLNVFFLQSVAVERYSKMVRNELRPNFFGTDQLKIVDLNTGSGEDSIKSKE